MIFHNPFLGAPSRVHNSMLALRKVVKRFEYKPKDARGPLLDVMRLTMPLLLGMSHQLLADDSLEAGQVSGFCWLGQSLCRNV